MNPIDYGEVVSALKLIHDSTTPADQRRAATQYCENLKQNLSPVDSGQLGFYLVQNAVLPPAVKHFGLHLVEHVVRQRWNELERSYRSQLQAAFVEVLKSV